MAARVEATEHDVLEAAHDAELRKAPAVGVEERDGVEEDVVVVVIERRGEREGVQVEGAVREHDAFGRAGAAAGVEEFGGGGLIDGHEVGHRDGVVLEQRGEGGVWIVAGGGVVDGDEEAVGDDVAKLVDDGSEVLLVEEGGGLRVAEDDFEL